MPLLWHNCKLGRKQMTEMPKEIWAESIEKMHFFTNVEDGEGCACAGFLTSYTRTDIHQVRVQELLESNNALLERARKTEDALRAVATQNVYEMRASYGEEFLPYSLVEQEYQRLLKEGEE